MVTSSHAIDSGYRSLETDRIVRGKLEATQEGHEEGAVAHDQEDSYSTASSLLQNPDIDAYIGAFATELSSLFTPGLDACDLERIFPILPNLLEAFAIRLGHENAERMQRQLMYLVHRFRL